MKRGATKSADRDRQGRGAGSLFAATRWHVAPLSDHLVVRAGDDLYVRSACGTENPGFVRAKASRTGRIRAGGIERDVIFDDLTTPDAHAAIDAAYYVKYDRYWPGIVGSVVGSHAAQGTFRLVPSD